ncbi:MAG TPA: protein kinase [Ktedonobacteraceae bacterium]|jgi:serine/threonine protein kinase|nr:protein kinase [Ktedonobacteraceae bacterium]
MTQQVGDQFSNYTLVKLLGSGGFAEVWLGRRLLDQHEVAIKVLNILLPTPDEQDTFLNEARHLGHLDHPHIIKLLDCGIQGSKPYLILDYAPHGTLRQQHPRGSILSLQQVLHYVKQIASGLQYAHDSRIIHRDIKPENMLLDSNNNVLLSDFGIAMPGQTLPYPKTQDVMGTNGYMAPEQLEGHPALASDQYSLAIVIFEWLCGSLPFKGKPIDIRTQQSTKLPDLRKKLANIPPALESVILKALSEQVMDRYRRVEEFADDFEKAINNPYLSLNQSTQNNRPASPSPQPAAQSAYPPLTPANMVGNISAAAGSTSPAAPSPLLNQAPAASSFIGANAAGGNTPPAPPNPPAGNVPPAPPANTPDPTPVNNTPGSPAINLGSFNPLPSPAPAPTPASNQTPGNHSPFINQAVNNGSPFPYQAVGTPPLNTPGPIVLPGPAGNNASAAGSNPFYANPAPGSSGGSNAINSSSTIPATPGGFSFSSTGSSGSRAHTPHSHSQARWYTSWLNPRFLKDSKNQSFFYGGSAVDFVLAVALGVLLNPSNAPDSGWYVWFFSFIIALFLRSLCVALKKRYFALFFATCLIIYWFMGSWALAINLRNAIKLEPVPPLIIALITLVISLLLHINYVLKNKQR